MAAAQYVKGCNSYVLTKCMLSCRMVSTTVLYGCHAIVSAVLAFKAHAVRRAVRQQEHEPILFQHRWCSPQSWWISVACQNVTLHTALCLKRIERIEDIFDERHTACLLVWLCISYWQLLTILAFVVGGIPPIPNPYTVLVWLLRMRVVLLNLCLSIFCQDNYAWPTIIMW